MLRLTVFRKFEVFGFVAGLVVKIPACAKPRPVMGKRKKTRKRLIVSMVHSFDRKLKNNSPTTIHKQERFTGAMPIAD